MRVKEFFGVLTSRPPGGWIWRAELDTVAEATEGNESALLFTPDTFEEQGHLKTLFLVPSEAAWALCSVQISRAQEGSSHKKRP